MTNYLGSAKFAGMNFQKPEAAMDYSKLSQEIVRRLRGPKKQNEMDRLIGYSYNQWHKWEKGQKKLKWSEFVLISQALNIDIWDILAKLAGLPKEDFIIPSLPPLEPLRLKFGNLTTKQISYYLDIDSNKTRRIFKENKDFEFSLFLKFLGTCSRTLPFFLDSITRRTTHSICAHPSPLSTQLKQISLESNFPWLSALEAWLEHKDYKNLETHSDEFLAHHLDMSIDQIKYGIRLLLENKAIHFEDNKYKLNVKRVDMENDTKVESAKLAKYWTAQALNRFSTVDGVPTSGKGWSYRIFPASKKAQEEIRKKILQLYGDIHQLLVEDGERDKECVQVFLLHFFEANEIKNKLKKDSSNINW